MMKSTFVSMLSAAALVSVAGVGHANTIRHYTGHECQPAQYADRNKISYFADGCSNDGSRCDDRVSNVALPISGNQSDLVDYDVVRVNYYDNSPFQGLACQVIVVNGALTSYYSRSLTSGDASQGSGSFIWTGSDLPAAGANISGTRSQYISCAIPARWSVDTIDETCDDEGFSYVHDYSVNAANP